MTSQRLVKEDNFQVKIVEYDENFLREEVIKNIDDCKLISEPSKIKWLQVTGIEDKEMIKKFTENFQIHQLTLEDILNLDQRAKIEEFTNYTYIALRLFNYSFKESKLKSEQLSILIYPGFLISLEVKKSNLLNNLEDQIRFSRGVIRKMDVDYLLYMIMDTVVDSYFYVLERIEERIQNIEDMLISNPTSRTLQTIHRLKRDLIQLQKNLWPLREVIGKLERAGYRFIKDQTIPFFRDLYDHIVTLIENVEMLHVVLSDMLDIYFSAVSMKLNEVMKMLTMIATVFMPLTFIAGIYGMNFRYMPELELVWGYPAVLLIMFGVGLWMVLYFKRKRWI